MLFNSYIFIFLVLPITILGYYIIGRTKHYRLYVIWLVAMSLLFYGWFNPVYVLLISSSILFNYLAGKILSKFSYSLVRNSVTIFSITANILLLGYFKYANFFIDNTNTLFNSDFHLKTIILPLAISFFTLQQIAYIVDTYRGHVEKHGFLDYCLFITFFPKLISGPITRFKEMMPQVLNNHLPHVTWENVIVGLMILFLGLFKKVILADGIGPYATPVFDAAAGGISIGFFNSWSGALAYTFQLYFDFSGYCDMGIGLSLMFGIKLPLNFYSPYKATSIIDFWRRWHMTLSRFLRDYLYIPLGGNRKGYSRQYINLVIVMIIAGLWHGAGWTFIIWGALHGLYLVINHGWRRLRKRIGNDSETHNRFWTMASLVITFISVVVAWVFFRADSLGSATGVLKGMLGMNGFGLPTAYYQAMGGLGPFLEKIGISFVPTPGFASAGVIWIVVSLGICWLLPNAQEYMSKYKPTLDDYGSPDTTSRRYFRWEPSIWGAVAMSVIIIFAILGLNQVSEFLYFQF
jgi:D-alanyl-lipoteichoic acid acyltransferase DltB (MBOAT superfamily)